MKEYRIVCTRDVIHYNGMKTHQEETCPIDEGVRLYEIYKTKEEAVKALARIKKTCGEYDAKSHENHKNYPNLYNEHVQTNFRIQSREVTKWE